MSSSVPAAPGSTLIHPRYCPGAVVFGCHMASSRVACTITDDELGRVRFMHSPDSWAVLWAQVFREVDPTAQIEVRTKFDAEGAMQAITEWLMFWSVVRVA